MDLGIAKKQEHLAEPLAGEDAERFVSYIENPSTPEGHEQFLQQADQVYREIPARSAQQLH
jgi:hypothetical protein